MSITKLTDRERELAAEVERLRTDAQVMGLALVERDAEIERLRAECAAIEEQAVKNCDEVLALREQLAAAQPTAVPLTDEQVWNSDELMSRNGEIGVAMPVLMRLIRAIERAHGIGEKP